MKFQAIKRYPYTAEVWETDVDDSGIIIRERLVGNVKLSLDTSDGVTLRIDAREPIRTKSLLRNIKDREGSLIYPSLSTNTGETYFVQSEVPLFGATGYLEGYTATARKLSTE